MTLVEAIVDGARTQLINFGIIKILGLGQTEHLGAIGCCKELTLAVEQLQGIPLTGIMRGGNDNTTIGTCHTYSQLGGWCSGITNIDDVVAHTHQGSNYYVTNHQA